MIKTRSRAQEHRDKIRRKFFPGEDAWTGENEKGWYKSPRTLPLILSLISSKAVSGRCDPTRVYLCNVSHCFPPKVSAFSPAAFSDSFPM